MELSLTCPDCQLQHSDPADARLGHLVPCLACSSGETFDRHGAEAIDGSAALAA